jgi:(2R)-3-sulfolactate dehydrogenase (NADP+)
VSTTRLSLQDTHDLIAAALIRSRTGAENAASVATALVAAEAAGQGGHGLRRVVSYCAQAASDKVNGFAVPDLQRTAPGALSADAGHGFAYPALDMITAALPDIAREQGVAVATVTRSHHCGVMGTIVEQFANAGLIALMLANTPGGIAPWGGKTPLFGTNPIAFAAPLDGDKPIVIDLSLSKVARGRIMAAKQKGEPIPQGWACDRDGNPTTDAAAALEGTMVPIGDAKGTALALMVELLAAGLSGANFAYQATSFFDAEGAPPGTGQFIFAIDPACIGGEDASQRFAALAARVAGDPGARLPGRRRQALRAEAQAKGIVANAALIAEIEAIGQG